LSLNGSEVSGNGIISIRGVSGNLERNISINYLKSPEASWPVKYYTEYVSEDYSYVCQRYVSPQYDYKYYLAICEKAPNENSCITNIALPQNFSKEKDDYLYMSDIQVLRCSFSNLILLYI
jgi:hypothetical protein